MKNILLIFLIMGTLVCCQNNVKEPERISINDKSHLLSLIQATLDLPDMKTSINKMQTHFNQKTIVIGKDNLNVSGKLKFNKLRCKGYRIIAESNELLSSKYETFIIFKIKFSHNIAFVTVDYYPSKIIEAEFIYLDNKWILHSDPDVISLSN